MDPTLVVIGREPCETSLGSLGTGAFLRLPAVEALQLAKAQKVTLGTYQEQQITPVNTRAMTAVETVVETVVDAIKPKRRYRRRDLRAEK